jgi:hypothetical protein
MRNIPFEGAITSVISRGSSVAVVVCRINRVRVYNPRTTFVLNTIANIISAQVFFIIFLKSVYQKLHDQINVEVKC